MKPRKNNFWNTLDQKDETYIYYYNRLKELAVSSFEWKNLPDSVDSRFMELLLYDFGSALFFKDDVLGHLALKFTYSGPLNVYRIPTKRRAFAVTGYSKECDESNSVIIWNNMLRMNTVNAVRHFARKLYNADRTIDVNVHAQKTPMAVLCDENERLSFENLYKQYDGFEPVIFGSKNLDLSKITSINTISPYVATDINNLKQSIWSEALEYLGISGSVSEKKERLITSEVEATMGGTTSSKFSRLYMRQEACEKINKMFGLNIEVDYRTDSVKWKALEKTINIEEGGDTNE